MGAQRRLDAADSVVSARAEVASQRKRMADALSELRDRARESESRSEDVVEVYGGMGRNRLEVQVETATRAGRPVAPVSVDSAAVQGPRAVSAGASLELREARRKP